MGIRFPNSEGLFNGERSDRRVGSLRDVRHIQPNFDGITRPKRRRSDRLCEMCHAADDRVGRAGRSHPAARNPAGLRHGRAGCHRCGRRHLPGNERIVRLPGNRVTNESASIFFGDVFIEQLDIGAAAQAPIVSVAVGDFCRNSYLHTSLHELVGGLLIGGRQFPHHAQGRCSMAKTVRLQAG
jgi:hypothetical protein